MVIPRCGYYLLLKNRRRVYERIREMTVNMIAIVRLSLTEMCIPKRGKMSRWAVVLIARPTRMLTTDSIRLWSFVCTTY